MRVPAPTILDPDRTIEVQPHGAVRRGQGVAMHGDEPLVFLHPLDFYAIQYRRDPHARLNAARDWLILEARADFDTLIRQLDRDGGPDRVAITEQAIRDLARASRNIPVGRAYRIDA